MSDDVTGSELVEISPMPKLLRTKLDLIRCPHCGVDTPNLIFSHEICQPDFQGVQRYWRAYFCNRCANLVMARAQTWDQEVQECYPKDNISLPQEVPGK